MKIEEIYQEWSEDCKIDPSELGQESLKIPELHNKYMKMFTFERQLYHALFSEFKKLKLLKTKYYMGQLSEEELAENNWEPHPLRVMKTDIDLYLEGDSDIIKLNLKVENQKEKISALESILKNIAQRNFHIRNGIDWEKFKVGG